MSDKIKEEPPICEQRWFSMLLEHACQMNQHILTEVSEEDLEDANVTVSAEFILDLTDCIIEYANRYENFGETMEELVMMYNETSQRNVKFGMRSVH